MEGQEDSVHHGRYRRRRSVRLGEDCPLQIQILCNAFLCVLCPSEGFLHSSDCVDRLRSKRESFRICESLVYEEATHLQGARARRARALWSLAVSYTHLRAHETKANLVCRLLLEKKKNRNDKGTGNHDDEIHRTREKNNK